MSISAIKIPLSNLVILLKWIPFSKQKYSSFITGRGAIHAHCIFAVTGGPSLKATKAAFKDPNYINPKNAMTKISLDIQVADVKAYLIRKDKEEKGIKESNDENSDKGSTENAADADVVMREEPASNPAGSQFEIEADGQEQAMDTGEEELPQPQVPKPTVDPRFDYETDSEEGNEAMQTEEPKKERDFLQEAYMNFSKSVIGNKMVENFTIENIGISNLHPIMDPMRWKPPFGQVNIKSYFVYISNEECKLQ